MHPRPWRLSGVVLATTVALGALSPTALAGGSAKLRWTDCGEGFECATATLPRDYARPRGAKVKLALIRLPAADGARRIGSLFVNPGGPGGSGVDIVRDGAKTFLAPLNERFDIVGWDPRGVGASTPAVDCRVNQETEGPFAQPFARPNEESERALVERVNRYVRRCAELNRDILPHISTKNTVRDLERLRALVGDRKLTYLGFSYGTQIGATYATFYPERIRRLVLDGAVDVEGFAQDPIADIRVQTAGFERALGRFFQACAAQQDVCQFGGSDPWAAFDDLLARLDATPIPAPGIPGGAPVDGDDARAAAALGMYAKFLWPILAQGLAQAEAGDGSLLRLLADFFYGREDDGTFSPGFDQFVAISSLDARWPTRTETYLRAGREAFELFEHFWWNSGYGDLAFGLWPVEPRSVFRGAVENAASAPTALVIGTTYDPATPYRWARRLTADLGNARLLTMRGDGHTAYGGNSPCIDAAVKAYLDDGTLPPEGTVCDQEVPFALPEAAATAAEVGTGIDAARRAMQQLHVQARPFGAR